MKVSLQQVVLPSTLGTTFDITDPAITSDFKGAILFGGDPTAIATQTANSNGWIGAVDATGRQCCWSQTLPDAVANASTICQVRPTVVEAMRRITSAGLAEYATYSSTLSNGVRLVVGSAGGGARLISALMLAGADLEFALSSAGSIADGTAAATITHNLTGKPDVIMILAGCTNGALEATSYLSTCIAFWDGTSSIGMGYGAGYQPPTATDVGARCGTAFMGELITPFTAPSTNPGHWTISAVGASTFTLTRSAASTGMANILAISWRCLSGTPAASAFLDQTPTTTGNHVVKTGMAVAPQLWLNVPTRLTATTFAVNDTAGSWGFGAAVNNNGATQQAAWGGSYKYGVTTSVAKNYLSSAHASLGLNAAGALDFRASMQSWDAGGLTEAVTTAASGAGERIHLMYGILPPSTFPSGLQRRRRGGGHAGFAFGRG